MVVMADQAQPSVLPAARPPPPYRQRLRHVACAIRRTQAQRRGVSSLRPPRAASAPCVRLRGAAVLARLLPLRLRVTIAGAPQPPRRRELAQPQQGFHVRRGAVRARAAAAGVAAGALLHRAVHRAAHAPGHHQPLLAGGPLRSLPLVVVVFHDRGESGLFHAYQLQPDLDVPDTARDEVQGCGGPEKDQDDDDEVPKSGEFVFGSADGSGAARAEGMDGKNRRFFPRVEQGMS